MPAVNYNPVFICVILYANIWEAFLSCLLMVCSSFASSHLMTVMSPSYTVGCLIFFFCCYKFWGLGLGLICMCLPYASKPSSGRQHLQAGCTSHSLLIWLWKQNLLNCIPIYWGQERTIMKNNLKPISFTLDIRIAWFNVTFGREW